MKEADGAGKEVYLEVYKGFKCCPLGVARGEAASN